MPDTPRILITGASGFIGRSLLNHLTGYDVVGTQFNSREPVPGTTLVTIDLRDERRVAEELRRLKPTIVFHFAALTSPGRNDLNPTLAAESHLRVTQNILRVLPDDAQVVFLSTDKVFDGTHPCPDEATAPKPSCLYGELKLECEDVIRRERPRHHILRLPIVHSDGEKSSGSFIDRAIEDLAAGRSVQAFGNVSRCYVKRHELVALLGALVADANYGTYHVGTAMSSYYDRIRSVCDEMHVEWRGKLVATEGSVRPTLQNLDTAKVRQTFDRTFS
jgi:dTDP-4-dehydrorhamnose reductase